MGLNFSRKKAPEKQVEKLTTGGKKKFELEDKPVLRTLNFSRKVDSMLRLSDIKSPVLHAAFQKNTSLVLSELQQVKDKQLVKDYEHILTLVFWFSIHLEDLNTASALLEGEFLLKQLVACALMNKRSNDEEDSDEDEEGSQGGEDWNLNSNRQSSESFKSENLSEEEKNNGPAQQQRSQQHEGGEEEFKEDDDDDEFFSNQGEDDKREPPTLEPKQDQPKTVTQQSQENAKMPETKADVNTSTQGKSLGQMLAELKKKKQDDEEKKARDQEQLQSQAALEAIGITQDMIKNTKLENIQQLIEIKNSFRAKFQNLMTNVLKIALQKQEEKLACIITAYYEVALEEEMIVRALQDESYNWLLFVWAFEKNYIGSRHNPKASVFITYEQLFDLIIRQQPNNMVEAEKQVKTIVQWKIISTDNILTALLAHHFDDLAIQNMGFYNHLLDKHLFMFSILHGNNHFLQNALLLAAFDKQIFREEEVINQILTVLKEGYRTNFLMNILTLIDISVWKNKYLKDLIEVINDYVEENYDKNRLLLSPNPLMSIALAAEILNFIARYRRKFENECSKIQQQLLQLGQMYSSKIEDEAFYESLIMDLDFKGRTVLKIITMNTFEPLMDEDDPKAENLMVMIWHGKEATRCDGNVYGYSNLAHIIMTRAKKISGKKTSFMQMITNYYEPNFKVDYSFQYRYRSRAVSFYFYKEFLCAFAMLVIFQYINYKYLILFSYQTIYNVQDGTTSSPINNVIKGLREYVDWNFFALFFSAALVFQLVLKIFFNMCSKKKIGIDKWTFMDSLSAFLNIIAVQVILKIKPDSYLRPQEKDILDYFMIIVLCICWLRFFAYFLVIRDISRLILTLMAMIGDTLSFMFIVSCFILIMASVFTTLYQDTNPDKYGGLAISVRYLFDAAIGQYDYGGMGDRNISHSVLLICHVFFSNILLLNYLIAILSTTYENMKETGIFKYKVNLYQYCERFLTAFNERAYGEMILHPPPLSYLSALMIPFLVSRVVMVYVSQAFSYMMYWMENLFFIFAFLAFEVIMAPIAYVKVWINIIKNSMGVLKTIFNCIVMLLIGFIMILILLFRDVCYLIRILCYHNGCRYGRIEEIGDEKLDEATRVKVYNETRSTVISLYRRLQKHMKQDGGADDDEDEDDIMEDIDFFHIEDDENMNEDFLYVVKKSLIIDEWKKRKTLIEKKRRILARNAIQGTLHEKLANTFKKKLTKSTNGSLMLKNKQSWSVNKSSVFNKGDGRKPKDITNQMKVVFLEALRKGLSKDEDYDEDVDMGDYEVNEKEIDLVDEFLTKFTIVSESSMNEHLDIMLMLKALPNKVMMQSLVQTELFYFRIFQESLIAYQNVDLVNAFEYIDDKNRERIQNVKEKLVNQKNNLVDVKDILELVKLKIERNEEYFSKQKGIPYNAGNLAADNSNIGDVTSAAKHIDVSKPANKIIENIHKKQINV